MKHILPFLILFFAVTSIQAQDVLFSTETEPVANMDTLCLTETSLDSFDVVMHTFATNNTRSTMNLRWELTNFSDQPEGWSTAICDDNQCYPPHILTNVIEGGNPDIPVVLGNGDASVIDLHVYPGGVPGIGHAQVCFSTKEEPDLVLGCMIFKIQIGQTVSSDDISPVGDVEIFPNPTTDYFGLTNNGSIKKVYVYNMLGRKIRSFDAGLGRKYYVGDMPAGMYLVAFLDKNGKVAKTSRLVKRFYHP